MQIIHILILHHVHLSVSKLIAPSHNVGPHGCTVANIYIGYGLRFLGSKYIPPALPQIQSEWKPEAKVTMDAKSLSSDCIKAHQLCGGNPTGGRGQRGCRSSATAAAEGADGPVAATSGAGTAQGER